MDGFVDLGRAREAGLGRHLYEMLGKKIAVIGVAKTPFRGTPPDCEILRGTSRKPLYVTAAGIEAESAKSLVQRMHGRGRLPTLLKHVDRLGRRPAAAP